METRHGRKMRYMSTYLLKICPNLWMLKNRTKMVYSWFLTKLSCHNRGKVNILSLYLSIILITNLDCHSRFWFFPLIFCQSLFFHSIEVPQERLIEIHAILRTWRPKIDMSRKQLESLIGKLSFISKCVRPGCTFISRLISALAGLPRFIKFPCACWIFP